MSCNLLKKNMSMGGGLALLGKKDSAHLCLTLKRNANFVTKSSVGRQKELVSPLLHLTLTRHNTFVKINKSVRRMGFLC